MTITQLEIFALVAELRGFTAAAACLGISQSAVSHALKSLENEWGVVLIARGKSDIEVTEIGKRLLLHTKGMLGENEAIKQELTATRGLSRGTLRVGSFGPTSSLRLLPVILEEFRRNHPGIDIFIDEGEDNKVANWILDRQVDVGFVVLPDERFDTVPLVEDELIALIPAGHVLAHNKTVSLVDLSASPFIMTTAGSSTLVEKLFVDAGAIPQIRHRFSQIITIVKMVENGEGVSIVAKLALPSEFSSQYRGVVQRSLSPMAKRTVGLAVRNREQVSPATEAFLMTAKSVLKKQPRSKA